MANSLPVDEIKRAASGRWLEILSAAGIASEVLDGRHHPCPKCGGTDRFRAFDDFAETGGVLCNGCFKANNGDGFAVIQWFLGCDFRTALFAVARHLGLTRASAAKGNDIVAAVATAKRMPVDAFQTYGATAATRGNLTVARVPVYDETGNAHSHFDLTADGKGLFRKGAGSSGLFLPGRLPKTDETWLIVEGVKDAAALTGLGYNAAGLPHSEMSAKYAQLFAGCNVIIVPDLDQPGQKGAATTSARLNGVAQSVRIARLPGKVIESGGNDVRDVLASDGDAAVRKVIEHALLPLIDETMPAIENIGSMIASFKGLAPPVIAGILRKSETANFIAASKVGKSWAVYGLGLSIATGRPWLGRFGTFRGRVLIIDNELHKGTLTSRISTVATEMGIPRGEYTENLDVVSLRGRLMDIESIGPLISKIEQDHYSLIVVDAWYRMFPPGISENDNAAMAQLYNLIDKYAESTGAAWLLIHHASKGEQGEKRVTDVGSGAGSQSRAADTHMILREHKEDGHAVLAAAVRSFESPEPVVLKWNYPLWCVADHLDAKFLATSQDKQQASRDAEGIEIIRNSLKNNDEAMSVRPLAAASGIGRERCERLLNVMHHNGEVIAFEADYRGRRVTKYNLSTPAS